MYCHHDTISGVDADTKFRVGFWNVRTMFYLPSVPRGTRKGLNQESCDVCSYMISFYETTIETDEKKENILLRLTSCRNFISGQNVAFSKTRFQTWLLNSITVCNPEVHFSKLQNNCSIRFLSTSAGFSRAN